LGLELVKRRTGDDTRVLTINAGSTSMKVELVEDGQSIERFDELDDAFATVPDVHTVAHRIVHGGTRAAAVAVDDDLVRALEALVDLAPLHQPKALDALSVSRAALPRAVHVACFDTAFHMTIPPAATTYAIPARLRRLVRVYGFHGLAHEWASRCVRQSMPGARRVVVAHLGGGQSLCAVRDGRSIATTMGFTPLDGLVMATRPGRVDPGAVLWLGAHTDEPLHRVFEHESGLVGLCGTDDFRTMVELADRGDRAATLAREVVRHRLVTEFGGMIATLGGLDAIAFSGGVGTNSAWIHATIGEAFQWLGVEIDPDAHGRSDGREAGEISAPGAAVRTFVISAGEASMMAEHALRVVATSSI
jgi:acetate kinase